MRGSRIPAPAQVHTVFSGACCRPAGGSHTQAKAPSKGTRQGNRSGLDGGNDIESGADSGQELCHESGNVTTSPHS